MSKLNDKLDLILKNQEKILKNEKKILKEESKIEELEQEELKNEEVYSKTGSSTLEELENLEKQIKGNLVSPIKKIGKRDLFKGFIGAFIGVMGHFAFSKATDIAQELTLFRASILYVVAFFIIVVMLYYTGFRSVEKHIVLKFMPLRAIILYSVSIVTIIIVNLLFGKIHLPLNFMEIYTIVGATIILAVMGAGTADLIGREIE